MEGLIVVLGFISFFVIAFGFAAYLRYLKYKETLKMIEAGLLEPPKVGNGRNSLRWGIIITAIGVALTIGIYPFGFLMDEKMFPLNFGPWMLIGLVPTFFGLALILIHYLTKQDQVHEETTNTVDVYAREEGQIEEGMEEGNNSIEVDD